MPQTKPEPHGEGKQPKSKAYHKVDREEAGEKPRSDVKTREPAKQSSEWLKSKVGGGRSPVPLSGKGRPPAVPAWRMSHSKNRYKGGG